MDETPDTTHRPPIRRLAAPALALAAAALVAGVATLAVTRAGDDDGSNPGNGGGSPEENAAVTFAQCMRDHGVEDFPDPVVDEDGGISIGDALADQRDTPDFQAAEDACEPTLDAAPAPPGPTLPPDQVATLQEQWLAVAECVRAEGHQIDDPHVDEYGRPQVQAETEAVEQALEDCVHGSNLTRHPDVGETNSGGEPEA